MKITEVVHCFTLQPTPSSTISVDVNVSFAADASRILGVRITHGMNAVTLTSAQARELCDGLRDVFGTSEAARWPNR